MAIRNRPSLLNARLLHKLAKELAPSLVSTEPWVGTGKGQLGFSSPGSLECGGHWRRLSSLGTPLEIISWDRAHFSPCPTKEETELEKIREGKQIAQGHTAH